MIVDSAFRHEYDLDSLRCIEPRGRSFRMYVTPRYEHHYVRNEYEKLTADLVARIATSVDTFIDVGAHYGFYSLLAAHHNPRLRILALEPTPVSCEILRRNVDLPGARGSDVHQAAASAQAGKERYILSASSDNCSFYEPPNAPPI